MQFGRYVFALQQRKKKEEEKTVQERKKIAPQAIG
jgi:hypothetical protein